MAPRGFLGSKKPSIFERAHDSPQLVCSGLARADLFESPTGQLWRSILFCLPSAFCIVPKFVYGFNLHRPNTTIPRKEWSLRSARDLVTPHPADDGRATNERCRRPRSLGRSFSRSVRADAAVSRTISPRRFAPSDGRTDHSLTHSLSANVKCLVKFRRGHCIHSLGPFLG